MRIRRPSPAVVMALAALVFSASGSATAGVLITTADIRDETIRSADIRDGTIASGDVRRGALSGVDVAQDSLAHRCRRAESSLGKVSTRRGSTARARSRVRRGPRRSPATSPVGHRVREQLQRGRLHARRRSKQGDGGGQPLFR